MRHPAEDEASGDNVRVEAWQAWAFLSLPLVTWEGMEGSPLRVASDGGEKHGAPSPTRTGDLRIRSPTLYPSELWALLLGYLCFCP